MLMWMPLRMSAVGMPRATMLMTSVSASTAQILDTFSGLAPLREIFEAEAPDAILVYGDTNSTLAAAIVAAHANLPLVHVEGGERLYRRAGMPEEVNRVVTDHLADLCLASSRKAVPYLIREAKIRIDETELTIRLLWGQDETATDILLGRLDVFDHFDVTFSQARQKIVFEIAQAEDL